MNAFAAMLGAALASSLITVALAWLWYQAHGRARLEAQLAQAQDEFERRVKAGVSAAAIELLPALREQVALGFTDALGKSHAAGIAEGTAKIVTGSTQLLTESLGNLFGLRKK
jgi:hypothetical protein